MATRQTFAVTLHDHDTGAEIATATRYAMNSGARASEGLVRDLARAEGTHYLGGTAQPRRHNDPTSPYERRWTSEASGRVVVARVALIEPVTSGPMTVAARDLLAGDLITEMVCDGDPLDHVTDAELDAGIKAAERWQAVAERANRRSDTRKYAQIVALLWAEYRRRLGWQAGNDGTGARKWFVYRETREGQEVLETADGRRTVRFATCDAARRRAFALNGMPAPAPLGV